MLINREMTCLPSRYNPFTLYNDALYYAICEIEGREFRDRFVQWLPVVSQVEYTIIFSIEDYENAICSQIKNGEQAFINLVQLGIERKPARREMLALLIYFVRLSHGLKWYDFCERYNTTKKTAIKTEKSFLERLDNNARMQAKVNGVCKHLIQLGSKRIKEQLK